MSYRHHTSNCHRDLEHRQGPLARRLCRQAHGRLDVPRPLRGLRRRADRRRDGAPRLEGSVAVDSIVVKDENLAGHLKSPDFFDSANYPQIRFRSTAVRVQDGGELEVEGELTIKDHTHNVTARGTITGPHEDIAGNDKLGVELETVVDRREFGLEWNAPLPKGGFAVDNDVKLQVSLELVRQA